MNLGDALRDTFSQEADMQTSTPPDVDALIHGGRVRRRRRNMTRIGLTAAIVVLAGGAAYGVSQIDPGGPRSDPGLANQPSETSESAPTPSALPDGDRAPIEPGTLRTFVGYDAAGERIEADMTVAGTGWESGDDPVVSDDDTWAGVGIYRPLSLPDGSGCSDDWHGGRHPAETTQGLAGQLARLPQGTVVQPPAPTEAFDHDAIHLRLRIDDNCPIDQVYRVAGTSKGWRGISYSDVPKEVIIDFWVVDLNGTPVVVDSWHQQGASADLIDRIARARESIAFATRR